MYHTENNTSLAYNSEDHESDPACTDRKSVIEIIDKFFGEMKYHTRRHQYSLSVYSILMHCLTLGQKDILFFR